MNNHHQNAQTTIHSRALIVGMFLKGAMNIREVADQFGVSRPTVYKWLARYRAGGEAALHNHSSRPHRSPRRMPAETVAAMAAMRRMRMTGSSIAHTLSKPLSTVTLQLRRSGLNRLFRLKPKAPVMRYEHEKPGDMIHLDINELGRIDGVGHRITGDRSRWKRGAGWEYLHVRQKWAGSTWVRQRAFSPLRGTSP
jgi:transposase-like protein